MGEAGRVARVADAVLVLTAALAVTLAFDVLDLPSPSLFGGLAAGLVRGLAGRRALAVPRPGATAAQGLVGVSIGALVDPETLAAIGRDWLPVLLVTVGTLVLSVLAGLVMGLQPGVSPVTGAFATIAGGAAGITAMSRELGADDRMVAVLQYLRVLLIVVLMPVAATAVFGAEPGSGGATVDDAGPGWPAGLLFSAACLLVGVPLARLLRIPVPAVLGPMLVAAGLDLGGLSGGAHVPAPLETAAFLLIGLMVGLNFSRDSLRSVGRALPVALAVILGLVAAWAGLGAVLAATTEASALDAYLATTPGGLYAVLATAQDGGADATFVLAVQVLRLFVMLLFAPLLARWLRRSGAG
ncbi:AbrB family transcriptional regulator [Geodermatophilus sp. DF01-2]|uniref:AbrB family transcriptional regulator n=1 Tax=Geodermatophilus sp. DF01-2 TaxID=2559610 RepID=UPI0010740B98|nr:AbrB family transcriptional regulator [Geodermatophilus sp. DF01_2]TFV54199.1 AbrB family transcriptional regulator [Geodermatophilus sp. DF01_2]